MKKFKTHNDGIDIDIIGSGLLDRMILPYNILVKTFGEPGKGNNYSTDAEWKIKFEDGRVVSIYNYKNGKTYLEDKGTSTKEITTWNIGGKNKSVVKDIVEIINDTLSKMNKEDINDKN